MSESKKTHSSYHELLLPPALLDATMDEHATQTFAGSQEHNTGDHRVGATFRSGRKFENDSTQTRFPEIEGYEIKSKLGQGGMGAVFLAVDKRLDREVAIKVVSQQVANSEKLTDRFISEVKAVAALNHPNIAQLYDAQMSAEPPYLVMEYVDGTTLEEYLQLHPQSAVATAELIQKIANAIEFCHQKGIIHRDLKPSNILLDKSGVPKVADFGLAKSLQSVSDSTRTGEIVGTPGYMAPEQASGVVKSLGPACDIYGLGAVLYRMLTGRPPFYSSEPVQTVMMVLSDDPVAPRKLHSRIPRDLETICLKCLAKKPERRYESIKHLVDDLQRFIDGKPIEARPVSAFERCMKWAKRRPALASVALISIFAIPAIIAGLWYHSVQLDQALQDKSDALLKTDRALKKADAELRKSTKLATEGSDFTEWIYREHLDELQKLNGSIEAQAKLADRIQKYLEAATPHMPDDTIFLRRHARAYIVIADIQGNPDQANLGNLKTALKNYDRGLTLYREALKSDPGDKTTRKILGNAISKKMELLAIMSGPDAAQKLMDEEKELLQSIQSEKGPEFRLLHIRFMQHRFYFAMAKDKFDEAMKILDAIDAEYAPINDPTRQVVSEVDHLKIWTQLQRGNVYERLGEFGKSEEHAKLAIAEAKRTHEVNPDDPKLADRYASTIMTLADSQFQQRKPKDALENFQLVESLRRVIWERNENNIQAAAQLATVLTRISTTYAFMGTQDKSIEYAKKGIELRRLIHKKQPKSKEAAQNLWLAITTLASSYAATGELKLAEKGFREQEALIKKHVDFDAPTRLDLATYAQCKFNLGLIELSRFGEATVAEETWKDIKETCRELPEFKSALKYFDEALAIYKRIEKSGPLNRNDENYNKIITKTKAMLIENSNKLDKLMNKSSGKNDI